MDSNHLTDADLQRLRRGGLAPEQIAAAGRHLATCALCAAAARRVVPTATAIDDAHPPIDELFAYVDGALDADARHAIDAHLGHCRICREDVADARDAQRSVMRHRSRTPWLAVAAALLVAAAAGALALWMTRKHPSPAAPPVPAAMRSVAVLPLQNASRDRGDDFLSVALADALTTRLAQIPSLFVPPTSAVIAMHEQKQTATTDGVISGDYEIAGGLIRAHLQLTDARTGTTVWTASVETPRDDLFALVDGISRQTLVAMSHHAAPAVVRGSAPHSSNAAAYQEYLQARALKSTVGEENADEIAHLQHAVTLDPNFAAAYADLSLALSMTSSRGEHGAAGDPASYARKAVTLDPNFAPAHVALARALVRIPGRLGEALREEATALRLDAKSTETLALLTAYLSARGDARRVDCVVRYLERLDPTAPEVRLRGYWYFDALDHDRVLPAAASALASPATALAGADLAASEWLLRGDLVQAQRYAQQAASLDRANYIGPSLIAMTAAAKGDATAAHAALARFEPEAQRNAWAAMRQALCYARLGDKRNAIRWAQRSEELGNRYWYLWTHHPWLQSLQGDAEFARIAGRMRSDLDAAPPELIQTADAICASR